RAKMGVYQNNLLLKTVVCHKDELIDQQRSLLLEYPDINHGILANVAIPEKGFKGALSNLSGLKIELSATTPIPFINTYETPQTLGLDRIALAAGAVSHYPNRDILIIDAGTSITYDLITADKKYLGGAISPGLNMRFRALNDFTANLPLLRVQDSDTVTIGKNTVESLQLGVKRGLLYEIDGFIDQYKEAYPELITILTGGDCEILSKRLKNSIFAIKNFLLSGLNCILEYNKH